MSACLSVRTLVGAVALLTFSACSSLTSSARAEVNLNVAPTSVRVDAARSAVSATLHLTIQNTGRESVFFTPCGTALERSVNGRWQEVWGMLCTLGSDTPKREIAPGEEFTTVVNAGGVLGAGVTEQWTEPVDGQYRLRVAMDDGRSMLPEDELVSRPFALEVQ